jgi:hypothetical protein
MLLDQIKNFEIFRPKMDSTKEVLHSLATFDADISPDGLRRGPARRGDYPE